MSRWFRHYAGMMRDDKLVSVAIRAKQPIERVVWVWGAILESAAEIDDDGLFQIDSAEIAYFLRTDESDICAILDALAASNRVAADRVVHWRDRQFKSDRSAERQAAYRDRKRGQVGVRDGEEASRNDAVTSPSRHRDAPETETDTEEDTEEDTERNISLDAEREFDDWYAAFPRHVGKGQARKAYRVARKKADAATLLQAALAAGKHFAGTEPQFIPHPATWLNGERWLDQPTAPPTPQGQSWRDQPEYRGVL